MNELGLQLEFAMFAEFSVVVAETTVRRGAAMVMKYYGTITANCQRAILPLFEAEVQALKCELTPSVEQHSSV